MKKKIINIFFIRHEVDFDTFLPLIISSNDPIIYFLSRYKLTNHPGWHKVRNYKILGYSGGSLNYYKITILQLFLKVITKLKLNNVLKSVCDNILKLTALDSANSVLLSLVGIKEFRLNLIFDHSVSFENEIIIEKLKSYNFPDLTSYALPHGFCSITNSMTSFSSQELEVIPKKFNMYDKVIVSDEVQYQNFLKGGVSKYKLNYLESLKYTKEWTKYFDLNFSDKSIHKNNSKLQILIIMTKFNANISKNEFFRSMKIILNLKDIEVLIKPHPRGKYDVVLMKKYFKDFFQVRFHHGHVHDAIKLSDIIISMPSSAILEANLNNKPVLYLPYLSSSSLNPYLIKIVKIISNPDEFYIFMSKLSDNIVMIEEKRLEFKSFDFLIQQWNKSLSLNLESKFLTDFN